MTITLVTATGYGLQKGLAAISTLALVIIASGFLFPIGASKRAQRLDRKLRRSDQTEEEKRKLTARRDRAVQQSGQSVFGVLLGADGRLSTSKTMAALWTVVVAYILFALIWVWPSSWKAALGHLWPTYLLLLGGPYAALVLAKASVSVRISQGSLQKTTSSGDVRLSDLVADDSGSPDLFDVQYVIFNVIAMAFVIDAFVRAKVDMGFPAVPAGLLLLTGGPAAVYVGNKAFGTNAAVIFSVSPSVVAPGDPFSVYGQNFDPGTPPGGTSSGTSGQPGAAGAAGGAGVSDTSRQPPTVTVGGVGTPTVTVWTDTAIETTAPATGTPLGIPLGVSVVTTAGQSVYLDKAITLRGAPILRGLDTAEAVKGDLVIASGTWSAAAGEVPTVLVGDITATVSSQSVPGERLSFIVPDIPNPPQAVGVVIVQFGQSSEPKTLVIRQPPLTTT